MSPQLAALLAVATLMGAAYVANRAVYAAVMAGWATRIWSAAAPATRLEEIEHTAARSMSAKYLFVAAFYQAVVIAVAVAAGAVWGRFL